MAKPRQLTEFQPRRTLAALEEVRRKHIDRIDQAAPPTESLLAAVRKRLLGHERTKLDQLAKQLSPVELKAVLQLLAQKEDSDVHELCRIVIRSRPRPDLAAFAWQWLVAKYPADQLEGALRDLGSALGWEKIDGREMIGRWFASDDLRAGILGDFARAGRSDLADWLEQCGLDARMGLHRETWRYLLTDADKELLARFSARALLSRATSEPLSTQDAFGRNYLVKLERREAWDADVVTWIRERYGIPPKGDQQNKFWRAIDEDIRLNFRRWANEREILEFFKRVRDPHGRFQFWKRYLDSIEEVRIQLNDEAMLMDFGNFGVAEFSEVGNAAYLYRRSYFQRILSQRHNSVGSMKNRAESIERIIHTSGWQQRYRPEVNRLVEESSK